MEDEDIGDLAKLLGEVAVLRLLVESMLSALPDEEQGVALVKYSKACERLIADMLGVAPREALVTTVQRATSWQAERLRSLGLEVPDLLAD